MISCLAESRFPIKRNSDFHAPDRRWISPRIIHRILLHTHKHVKIRRFYPQNDGNFMCDVAIPNKEIIFVYEKEVLNRTNQNSVSVSISQAIFSGDTKKLQSLLENFMLQSISAMDGANEAFYHGMMRNCAVWELIL